MSDASSPGTTVPTREQIIGRQISNGCYTDTELDGQPCCDGCWCVHEATMEAEGIVTDG